MVVNGEGRNRPAELGVTSLVCPNLPTPATLKWPHGCETLPIVVIIVSFPKNDGPSSLKIWVAYLGLSPKAVSMASLANGYPNQIEATQLKKDANAAEARRAGGGA